MPDAPEGGTTTTTTAPAGAGTTPQGGDATPKTFTQDQLDRIVGERLARERAGYADYDDLKTKAAEFDKLTEAQKTELQKAQDRAAEHERKSLQLEGEITDLRLRQAVTTMAVRKGIVDPEAAVALLDRSTLTFDKAGVPTNLETVIDALVAAKPYLAGRRPGNGSGEGGPRGGTPTGEFDPNKWFHDVVSRRNG